MDYNNLIYELNFEMSDIMMELSDISCDSNIINSANTVISNEGLVIDIIETAIKVSLKILEWIFNWIQKIWTTIKKVWNATINRNKDAKFTIHDLEIRVEEIMIGDENPLIKQKNMLISIDDLREIKTKFTGYEDYFYFDPNEYVGKASNIDIVNSLFESDKYVCLCDSLVRNIDHFRKFAKNDIATIRRSHQDDRQERIEKIRLCSEKLKDSVVIINNTNLAMLTFERKVYGIEKLHNHFINEEEL